MWLEKQKAVYSRELEEFKDGLQKEQKRIQAGIDRHVLVTRAQFETEFSAVKDVFKNLYKLLLAMNGLRPTISTSPAGESREKKIERLFERLKVVMSAYDQVVTAYGTMSPFYPEEIYNAVQECLQAANVEILMVQTAGEPDTFKMEWFQEGERNRANFMKAYKNVSALMRKRLETLSVLPNG